MNEIKYNNLIAVVFDEKFVESIFTIQSSTWENIQEQKILSRDVIWDAPVNFKLINLKNGKILINGDYIFSIIAPSHVTNDKIELNIKNSMDENFDIFSIKISKDELSFFEVLKNLGDT